MQKLIALLKDEEAPTAVEYAIMVMLIATVIVVAVGEIGKKTAVPFNTVAAALP